MSVPNKREFILFIYKILELKDSLSADIHWPGSHDAPPPDVPDCGFLGNDPSCQGNGIKASFIIPQSFLNDDVQFMAILTLFLVLTFGGFILMFYYIFCK